MYLNSLINSQKREFDIFFKKLLDSKLSKDILSKAIFYGSTNGGKRIRPLLVSIFSRIANLKKNQYLYLASAIECIHSYSLIHDDLPSMDNDDFRRGKPSTHKKFDEATAILAGDALHDLAFEILSDNKIHKNAKLRILLIRKLSESIGLKGLAGGQSLDLLFENRKVSFSQILKMYEMKTSKIFSFACSAPYILKNKNSTELNFASDFGKIFGLVFQIKDDILDAEANFISLGKTPGKDIKQGKSTLLSINKKEKLMIFCLDEIKKFEKKYKKYFNQHEIFKLLLDYNIKRVN